jgi:hypothetical protein
LYYEKYLAANFTVPVHPQKGPERAEEPLCVYDARYEQDLHPAVPDCVDHYANETNVLMC